jgi:hypothetical protein
MRTLLLSGILYLIGIIIVLFLRPALMFNEKGEWKEFGLISPEHTVFTFWMFCLVWAILSYIICLFVIGEFNNKAVAVVAGMGTSLYESELPEDLVPVLPTKNKSKKKDTSTTVKGDMKPGYYKLDTKELDRTGVPKYLYVGEDMPGPVEVEE